jgi:hypothetical protein
MEVIGQAIQNEKEGSQKTPLLTEATEAMSVNWTMNAVLWLPDAVEYFCPRN